MRFAIKLLLCLCLANTANAASQWQLVAAQSTVGFTASYDGIAFDGVFEKFSVELAFDPQDLDSSHLSSSVNTTSVNTNSRDRDDALADPAWFHFNTYPQASFSSHAFSQKDKETFIVTGTLTIRDQQQEISFPFKWNPINATQVKVDAEFTLDRRDYDIGNGEWAEDETIGFTVAVSISLLLSKEL